MEVETRSGKSFKLWQFNWSINGNDDGDVAFTLNNKGKKKKGSTGGAKGNKEKEKKETPIKTGRVKIANYFFNEINL
jgi:hypothetical protein